MCKINNQSNICMYDLSFIITTISLKTYGIIIGNTICCDIIERNMNG